MSGGFRSAQLGMRAAEVGGRWLATQPRVHRSALTACHRLRLRHRVEVLLSRAHVGAKKCIPRLVDCVAFVGRIRIGFSRNSQEHVQGTRTEVRTE